MWGGMGVPHNLCSAPRKCHPPPWHSVSEKGTGVCHSASFFVLGFLIQEDWGEKTSVMQQAWQSPAVAKGKGTGGLAAGGFGSRGVER